jgi:hypothetical protein
VGWETSIAGKAIDEVNYHSVSPMLEITNATPELQVIWPPYDFKLSGRGIPNRNLFCPLTSYNFASKSRSIPGPIQ